MKSLMTITMIIAIAISVFAGETKVANFKVSGNCEMCEMRIEAAAKIKGVLSASWNADTQILTVKFDPEKVTLEAIQQKIAKAGHDTESFKATENVYKSLPKCCQYRQ
jgi:copper chaperone CopZ